MNLECSKEKIRSAVYAAERITGKNLSLPILSHIILETKDRLLKIRSTNLDLGLEISLPCKINQGGLVAVSGAVLNNFFANLPSTEDKIKIELNSGQLIISSPHHTTAINGFPPADFPIIPAIDTPNSFNIPSAVLLKGLKNVWYSAAISSLKPEISSVCFYQQPDNLSVVATDSFRLAESQLLGEKIKISPPQLIIPLKNALEIIRSLESLSGTVEIRYNQHQLAVIAENFYLTSRLIDGVYPDYRQIMPNKFATEAVINRGGFLDSLKLVNVFADKFNQAELSVAADKKSLEIKTKNDQGNSVSWFSPQSIIGENVKLALNLKYLLDGLQTIASEQVVLKFNGASKPVVIAGQSDPAFTYLIMPIRR